MTARPRYDDRAKDEAVALARLIGPTDAGRRLGIPHTSISRWLAQGFSAPEVEVEVIATEEHVAQKLWTTFSEADRVVRKAITLADRRLDDPEVSAREAAGIARDVSGAMQRAAEQWQLLTGRVTERTEVLGPSPEDMEARKRAYEWMEQIARASEDEVREWMGLGAAVTEVVDTIRGPRRDLEEWQAQRAAEQEEPSV